MCSALCVPGYSFLFFYGAKGLNATAITYRVALFSPHRNQHSHHGRKEHEDEAGHERGQIKKMLTGEQIFQASPNSRCEQNKQACKTKEGETEITARTHAPF